MARKQRVSIITVHGQIYSNEGRGGISPDQMRRYFQEAIKHKSKLIVLDINSPGGSPVGSTMIHNMILELRKKEIKVVAHCRDICASGGYLIVSACDEIYGYPSSMIGSIGVIMSMFGFEELLNKIGVEYREHTAGEFKAPFSMFKPETEESKTFINHMLADVHSDFIATVFSSRKNESMTDHKKEITSAKIYTGTHAKAMGLIDGFRSIKEIFDTEYGEDAKFKIHRPKEKSNVFRRVLGHGLNVSLKFDSGKDSSIEYR